MNFFSMFVVAGSCQASEDQKLIVNFIIDLITNVNEEDNKGEFQGGLLSKFELLLLFKKMEILFVYLFGDSLFFYSGSNWDVAFHYFSELIDSFWLKLAEVC